MEPQSGTIKVFKRNLLDTKFLHKVWSSWEFTKEDNKTWMVTRLRDDSPPRVYFILCN